MKKNTSVSLKKATLECFSKTFSNLLLRLNARLAALERMVTCTRNTLEVGTSVFYHAAVAKLFPKYSQLYTSMRCHTGRHACFHVLLDPLHFSLGC